MALPLVEKVWNQIRRRPGTDWCRFCRKDVETKHVVGGTSDELKCGECGACFRSLVLNASEAFGPCKSDDALDSNAQRGAEARMDRTLSEYEMLVDFLGTTRRARFHTLLSINHVVEAQRDVGTHAQRVEALAQRVKHGCDAIRAACISVVGGRFKPHVSSAAVEYWMAVAAYISDVGEVYKPMQWAAACLYLAGFQRDADHGFGFHLPELLQAFELGQHNETHLRRAIRRAHKILQVSELIEYAPPQKVALCGVYLRRLSYELDIPVRIRAEAGDILKVYCSASNSRLASREIAGLVASVAPTQVQVAFPQGQRRLEEFPRFLFHLPVRIACACLSLASIVVRTDTELKHRQINTHTSNPRLRSVGITQYQMEHHLGLRTGSVSTICSVIASALRHPNSGYHAWNRITSGSASGDSARTGSSSSKSTSVADKLKKLDARYEVVDSDSDCDCDCE